MALLGCYSNFSFLTGASHPHEMAAAAAAAGWQAVGIADVNSLAGIVRAHVAAREHGIRLVVGARLQPVDGPEDDPAILPPTWNVPPLVVKVVSVVIDKASGCDMFLIHILAFAVS